MVENTAVGGMILPVLAGGGFVAVLEEAAEVAETFEAGLVTNFSDRQACGEQKIAGEGEARPVDELGGGDAEVAPESARDVFRRMPGQPTQAFVALQEVFFAPHGRAKLCKPLGLVWDSGGGGVKNLGKPITQHGAQMRLKMGGGSFARLQQAIRGVFGLVNIQLHPGRRLGMGQGLDPAPQVQSPQEILEQAIRKRCVDQVTFPLLFPDESVHRISANEDQRAALQHVFILIDPVPEDSGDDHKNLVKIMRVHLYKRREDPVKPAVHIAFSRFDILPEKLHHIK